MNLEDVSKSKTILVLLIITIFFGFLINTAYRISSGQVDREAAYHTERLIFLLTPLAKDYQLHHKQGYRVYDCYDEKTQVVGKFFIADGIVGSTEMKIAVSMTPDWKNMIGIQVLEPHNPSINVAAKELAKAGVTPKGIADMLDRQIKIFQELGL